MVNHQFVRIRSTQSSVFKCFSINERKSFLIIISSPRGSLIIVLIVKQTIHLWGGRCVPIVVKKKKRKKNIYRILFSRERLILSFDIKIKRNIFSSVCAWYIEVRCNILKFVSIVDLHYTRWMRWTEVEQHHPIRLSVSRSKKKISWYINAIIYKYILYMWLIIFEKVMHNNRFKKEERSWKGKKKGKEEETYSSF